MGVVLTINKIDKRPKNFDNVVVGTEEVLLEGSIAIAETRIFNPNAKQRAKVLINELDKMEEDIEEEFYDMFPDDALEDEDEEEWIPGGDITDYEKYILHYYSIRMV